MSNSPIPSSRELQGGGWSSASLELWSRLGEILIEWKEIGVSRACTALVFFFFSLFFLREGWIREGKDVAVPL